MAVSNLEARSGSARLRCETEKLTFSLADFQSETFSVERVVGEFRKKGSLTDLRSELESYFKYLKSSMIELINNDYSDFVRLSSKLVGLDSFISTVSRPLESMYTEFQVMQEAIRAILVQVTKHLENRTSLQAAKVHLALLLDLIDCVESLEGLLCVQQSSPRDQTSLPLLRVAVEYNHLQYLVSETGSDSLVQDMLPRIEHITCLLLASLEQLFTSSLADVGCHGARLRQCLQTYAVINKQALAHDLYRESYLRPLLEETLRPPRQEAAGVKAVLDEVLQTTLDHCMALQEVAEGLPGAGPAPLHTYDFLVQALWPEVVTAFGRDFPSLFTASNPDIFYRNFTASLEFLSHLETCCAKESRVRELRAHPSYSSFMSKWTLPVYFQIRFQEIAGSIELAFLSPFEPSEGGEWSQGVFGCVWEALLSCWKDGVFLNHLLHRYWKLSLQILARLSRHLHTIMDSKLPSLEWTLAVDCAVASVSDMNKMISKLPELFSNWIKPRLPEDSSLTATVSGHLLECCHTLGGVRSQYVAMVINVLSRECSCSLEQVSTIPRLYRRTNKEVPSRPSLYVDGLLRPLQALTAKPRRLTSEDRTQYTSSVLARVVDNFLDAGRELLASVKRTEDSLLKLMLGRRSVLQTAKGMSDDNKIRLQLHLDIEHFLSQVADAGVSPLDAGMQALKALGASAKALTEGTHNSDTV